MRLYNGPVLKLIENDDRPIARGCDVVDELVALLDARIPQLTHQDPCLSDLRDLRDVLAVGQARRRRPSRA